MENLALIILAAGLGKRMGSNLPKVTISTREKPLIQHLLCNLNGLPSTKTIIVTGHKRELVEEVVLKGAEGRTRNYNTGNIQFAFQAEQLGTGDAVKSALPLLSDFSGMVLILYGDTPLVSLSTLKKFLAIHKEKSATLSLISFNAKKPNNYGRVVRDPKSGLVTKIVEAKDCSPEELEIDEVNSGIYIVDSAFLTPAINELKNHNNQKEYYLTDILERAYKEGQVISSLLLEDESEVVGVNNNQDLNQINKILLMKKIKELIDSGVKIEDPASTYIDSSVQIGSGCRIGPNVQIIGDSNIGPDVEIEGSAYIKNCRIGKGSHIKFCVRIEDSALGNENVVGPFANIRPGCEFAEGVKVGNFVETKKAVLKEGVKASHLSYLGDCSIGKNTNIGAGTITCNYDGYQKFETKIGEDVFIGSNSALVAPVSIGDGSTIGAGSTITENVEKDSLAFTRAPQVAKPEWSKKKREKSKKK